MKTLITEEQLREGIRRLAGEIQKHYEGKPLTIVGVLIGSVVLLADLIRLLPIPVAGGNGSSPQLWRQWQPPGTAGDQLRSARLRHPAAATCCWSTTSSTPATRSGT